MNIPDFRDKKIVIMGLGVNQGGLGIAKWLLKHGARLTVTDLKDQHALAPSIAELERAYIRLARKLGKASVHRVAYVLGKHRADDFRKADMVIQNPGVPRESPYLAIARKRKIPIESDVSIFFRLCPHPIVGVSGTKGKTTVTALSAAMLKEGFGRVIVGGNIRRSPLDGLDALIASKEAPPIVLELSSWQLESLKACRKSPRVAVLTNVLPDHLDRYRGMDDYAKAKELIYAWQTSEDVALVPHDNPYARKMGARVPGERVWASPKFFECGENILAYRGDGRAVIRRGGEETTLFHRRDVMIPGAHNLWNALLAGGAAFLRGARPPAIRKALRGFEGVPYRLERVAAKGGISFWNDSAATTPEASIAAMRALDRKIVLLAGGADKKLEFGAWAREAKRHCREIVLFEGTATLKMRAVLKRAGAPVGETVRTMTSAVLHAARAAKRGDAVLLSPGCASFGLFINEFDRGDRFREAVRRLR